MNPSYCVLTFIQRCYLKSVVYQARKYTKKVKLKIAKREVLTEEQMPIYQYATENTKRRKRIYMWGNAMLGALGHAKFFNPNIYKNGIESIKRPFRLPFGELHKVRDLCCGNGFTVFAASNDENDVSLFGTGFNRDFQIGYHCKRRNRPLEVIIEPVPIALPLSNMNSQAIKVGCGRAHTVAITDKDGVFSLGNNNYGQCGVPEEFNAAENGILKIHRIEGINEAVTEVVCGQDHTFLLTESGKVYSCGRGAAGQTGLGHNNDQFIPSLVKGDIENEKIIRLSCLIDCVLAVSEKGDLFGWGNSEYGQLKSGTDKQQINIPCHLNLGVGKVKQAACGSTMCGVITDKGHVYVWGYGILGQGPQVTTLRQPALLPPPLFGLNEFSLDMKVEKLVCGMGHFAAVTNYGHLYMWGRNRNNCLGLNRESDQYFPLKVCIPAEVLKVSCGVDHTAVISRAFT